MEIREMNLEQIEERRAALAEEIKTADMERLNAINAELDEIEKRKAEIKAQAEERAKVIEEVLQKPAEPTIITEERTPKKMTDREFRSTPEYIDAYVEYVKKGYDLEKVGAEKRTLLTENADGSIAVPVYIEDKINTSWENNEIMRRVRRTYLPGNVKVGVEVSASGAVVHEENAKAIEEENLEIEFVTLIPDFVKKMVKVSHAALALTSNAFLDYLYDEIEYQLVKKCAEIVVQNAALDTHTQTVQVGGNGFDTTDVIAAEGLLNGDTNPVLITSRAYASTLKAAVLSAGYGYDPFDGLEVIYVSDAILSTLTIYGLVVDLNAIQCNFPDGAEPKFIFDEYTEAPANIVRIIGRLMMAAAVVETGKIVKITA